MVEKLVKYVTHPIILSACICVFFIYSGIVPCKKGNTYYSLNPLESVTNLSGIITSSPSMSGNGKSYAATLKVKKVMGAVPEVRKETLNHNTNSGINKSVFSASGTINVQLPSLYVETHSPGKLYSISKTDMFIEKGSIISCIGTWSTQKNSFIVTSVNTAEYSETVWGRIEYFRALCRLFFKRLMFSWGSAGALILSLLSGSRDYLSSSIRDAFRNAGLSHILALSGMHLSFFSGIAGSTSKKIVGKKYTLIPQVVGVLLFVWFAGLSPSLFRALLCSITMLIASTIAYRKINILAVLSAAFLVHSVLFPQDIFNAAFMLSYGALAGILTVSEVIKTPFSMIFTPTISSSLSSSIGAQVATSPISISLFGELTPIGIISSTIVSPLITFFLTVSLIAIVLSLCIPFLSPLFGSILNKLYIVIVYFVELFAKVRPIAIL